MSQSKLLVVPLRLDIYYKIYTVTGAILTFSFTPTVTTVIFDLLDYQSKGAEEIKFDFTDLIASVCEI